MCWPNHDRHLYSESSSMTFPLFHVRKSRNRPWTTLFKRKLHRNISRQRRICFSSTSACYWWAIYELLSRSYLKNCNWYIATVIYKPNVYILLWCVMLQILSILLSAIRLCLKFRNFARPSLSLSLSLFILALCFFLYLSLSRCAYTWMRAIHLYN